VPDRPTQPVRKSAKRAAKRARRSARALAAPPCPDGWTTGPPDFVGVGAQKCGTTWWFHGLTSHPGVVVERGTTKELLFFERSLGAPGAPPMESYYDFFPRPPGGVNGEWSPGYMFDAFSIPALHALAPDTKILVLLRDPVARFLSGISRAERRGNKVSRPLRREHVQRGLYHEQLVRLLDWYGESQVMVLQYERCRDDPLPEMRRTFSFLGLDDRVAAQGLEREFNITPDEEKPVYPDDQLRLLTRSYLPDVQRLVKDFPQIDLSLWPNFSHLT
jgi:hypothetical protein